MPPIDAHRSYRALSLAIVVAWLGAGCGAKPPELAPPAVPVQVQALQPGTLEQSSEFIGALEAEQRVELKPEVAGRITQILVAPGDAVGPGQPIVLLRPDQAQAEVAGAQAGAEAARFGRDAAQAQVEAAAAAVAQAGSEAQLAQVEFNRTQQLVGSGALSRQDLDTARNRLDVAQATQQQAEESLRSAQSQLQQATASFDQAQAQVNVNQESLGFKQVSSPVGGLVGDLALRVGDFVDVGQTITTIIQNQELFLRIQVPTTRANQLRTGLPVELLNPDTGSPLATGSSAL
ncbi:MAG: HlyD family efflux transporter periplasmic adaptor subunit, partial [Leptolyngbyaceae cyanobacterium SM2_5_2]|nr:HlyD family efflux transporter periplasmic adaptor subunit [Leptolyngbyaceae cyanobacterium SM2_5_2]